MWLRSNTDQAMGTSELNELYTSFEANGFLYRPLYGGEEQSRGTCRCEVVGNGRVTCSACTKVLLAVPSLHAFQIITRCLAPVLSHPSAISLGMAFPPSSRNVENAILRR